MEPVTLTAATIATLAFTKFLEKTVEKYTEAALTKMDQLRRKIWDKLRGNPKAEKAIAGIENGSKAELEKLAAYLQVAMNEDVQFNSEIQAIAQEIKASKIQGQNVQNIYGGEAYQAIDNKAPTFQGGNHTISITYSNHPNT